MIIKNTVNRLAAFRAIVIGFLVLQPTSNAHAQTDAALQESDDTHYFDFWPGTWVEVVDGVADTSAAVFKVRQSVNPSAFEEEWRLVYEGKAHHSTALRAWDQVTNRWMFSWVSDNGLFQVWDGVKVGDDWYITKEFDIEGEIVQSRQAWIPDGDDRLTRILQRSTDGGKTWETRYRTVFEKVQGP